MYSQADFAAPLSLVSLPILAWPLPVMPFVANTPESLLDRADSKNPASTCRGITSSGRPCRRPLSLAAAPPRRGCGQLTSIDLSDERLYCWQHKEQVSRSARSSPGPAGRPQPPLKGRSSLDTLSDRLGLIDISRPTAGDKQRPPAKISHVGTARTQRPPPKKKHFSLSKLFCCFCFSVPTDEPSEKRPVRKRPQPRPVQQACSAAIPPPKKGSSQQQAQASNKPPGAAPHAPQSATKYRPAKLRDLIPATLNDVTASALFNEMSRPFADAEEDGYIYMFWLTPSSRQTAAPVDAARSLLAPPSHRAAAGRPNDVVSRFADSSRTRRNKPMLLKIGRAANVQRRMNQWQRQCGYDIEMLRYYPYIPGASDASATGVVPRMTPHCRRVERLVHLELAGMGLRANLPTCGTCGRDHREWFQVEAMTAAVRAVDGVIRKWVTWDEASG